jgi:ribonuclease BN (tRNA processing enzyme)
VQGLVEGFLWDRVDGGGPAFEIAELHGGRLRRFAVRAGEPGCQRLDETAADDGVLLREPGFQVRAVTLDHHTPVLAFAYEPAREIQVRKERLSARGLSPGPWLGELKRRYLAGEEETLIRLPGGGQASVAGLAGELLLSAAGKRLVYATDLADTADNRQRLIDLARHAHTLFCEATFIDADIEHARRNGHLTARACGEIAEAAAVARLLPFHISRRYLDDPAPVYDELLAACGRVVVPPPAMTVSASAGRAAAPTLDFDGPEA